MNIRIIKNAHKLRGNVYRGKSILEKEFAPSEYEGINFVQYFLYDVEANQKRELLPNIKKYDILRIKKLDKNSDDLYFTTISDNADDNKKITLHRYNILTEEIFDIYSYEDDIIQYNNYKRIRVFILNEFYILLQNEFIRYNLTETYKGYFDFEQFLFCIKDQKLIEIMDENFKANGIDSIKMLPNNMCVIKTGFSLIRDERYKLLEKNQVSVERISFANIGQLVSDILLMQKNLVLDTIDQAYYTETFSYMVAKGEFIVYSKYKIDLKEEEVIFYNYETKDTKICINKNVENEQDLAWNYIIGHTPYIRLRSKSGARFYNMEQNKTDIVFPDDVKVETVVNDLFIISGNRRTFWGKAVPTIEVYSYPDRRLIHKEKGEYIGCIATDRANIYILTK